MTPDPIRVGFVLHVFDTGGLERCVATLSNQLAPGDFEFTIYCMQRSGSAARWLEGSRHRVVELHKGMGNRPTLVPQLARDFRRSGIDIVHSHNWATLVESALARRLAGVRGHVHAEHGRLLEMTDTDASGLRRRARQTAMRWAVGSTGKLVVVSEESRQIVLRHRLGAESQTELVPNGIDLTHAVAARSRSAAIRAGLRIPDNSVVVGTVGRLDPIKGLDVALAAVRQASESIDDLHFLVVGDGPERERLEGDARRLGIAERVHFAGIRTAVFDWLGAIDIFVNSSHSEGMSIAMLEAMAAARPIVATSVGHTPRLLGGEPAAGILVPPADESALREAIIRLARDPSLQSELGGEAERRCRRDHSAEAMCQHYRRIYFELAGRTVPTA